MKTMSFSTGIWKMSQPMRWATKKRYAFFLNHKENHKQQIQKRNIKEE